MISEKINLCAPIPAGLHRQVRERQTQSGKSLGEYMTWLITEFYQSKEEPNMMNTETRTVAFQVPTELFEEFKDYLQRHGMKQKEFFLACIQEPSRMKRRSLLQKPNRRLRRSRRICRKKTNKIKLVRRRMTWRRFF